MKKYGNMKSPIFICKTRKGQVFTWDLAISVSIFLIVLAMLFYMWDSTTSKATETKEIYEIESIATDVTEQLIRTSGVPHDWENSSKYNVTYINAIGLADIEPRILNEEKILKFVNSSYINYSSARSLLGTQRYDFYFKMTYFNETINETQLAINGTPIYAGEQPSHEAFAITARRTAILNDTIVRVYFTVWTNKTYA